MDGCVPFSLGVKRLIQGIHFVLKGTEEIKQAIESKNNLKEFVCLPFLAMKNPQGILKKEHFSSPSIPRQKKICWDEENIKKTDIQRQYTKTCKIDEPKTPFIRSIPLADYLSSGGEEESTGSSSRSTFELSPPAEMKNDGFLPGGNATTEDEKSCEESDHDLFVKRRESHYKNMKESIILGKTLLQKNFKLPNESEMKVTEAD